MTRSRFSQINNSVRKSSKAIPITQIIILGFVITLLAAIFVQNLQPAIQIVFLGQKTVAIPLSVAMLGAFAIGGLIAFVFNAIASWRQNVAIRKALVATGSQNEPQNEPKKEQGKPDRDQSNYISNDQDDDEQAEDDWDEEDDWEEEEDEYFEEDDDDPDTVPYGDRQNLKSKKTTQVKRDRPPLEAKYIR